MSITKIHARQVHRSPRRAKMSKLKFDHIPRFSTRAVIPPSRSTSGLQKVSTSSLQSSAPTRTPFESAPFPSPPQSAVRSPQSPDLSLQSNAQLTFTSVVPPRVLRVTAPNIADRPTGYFYNTRTIFCIAKITINDSNPNIPLVIIWCSCIAR